MTQAINGYGSSTLQDAHPENLQSAVRPDIKQTFDKVAVHFERLYAKALANGQFRQAEILRHAIEQWLIHGNLTWCSQLLLLKRFPVTMEHFMTDEDFMGGIANVWPSLKTQLYEMNPDVFTGEAPVYENLLGGATGIGKTFLSDKSNAYQLYLLTCFDHPQIIWQKQKNMMIVLMFMSVSQQTCKRVIYTPFKQDFLSMPYASRFITYDKYKESTLLLGGNIEVVPALATLNSMVGQAVIGGIIDEVNFMARVENSKQVAGPRGMGGMYDQAEQVYFNITRRRQSRFPSKRGLSIGNICVISSTRYKGDFLDRRIDEVVEHKIPNVKTFRKKRYEVVPAEDNYSGETFRIIIGSENWPTRILQDHEVAGKNFPLNATVENVPIEHKKEFIQDPENALRDIIGIATDTISAFIKQRHKVMDAIVRGTERKLEPWLDRDEWDLQTDGFPVWDKKALRKLAKNTSLLNKTRWAHIDLSTKQDACGVAVIRHDGFMNVITGEGEEQIVTVKPKFTVEAAFAIKPSGNHEIDIPAVRNLLLQLGTMYGIALREITFDGYQSSESIQTLLKSGVRSRVISMDRTTVPYQELRTILYEDRIDIISPSDVLWRELTTLEFYADKNKVDHPPTGSKDVADAVTGAIQAALTSRVLRRKYGQVDGEGKFALTNRPDRDKPAPQPRKGRRKGGRLVDYSRPPGASVFDDEVHETYNRRVDSFDKEKTYLDTATGCKQNEPSCGVDHGAESSTT